MGRVLAKVCENFRPVCGFSASGRIRTAHRQELFFRRRFFCGQHLAPKIGGAESRWQPTWGDPVDHRRLRHARRLRESLHKMFSLSCVSEPELRDNKPTRVDRSHVFRRPDLQRALRFRRTAPSPRPGLACPSYGRGMVCANHGTHGGSATSPRDSAAKGEPARCGARAAGGSSPAATPPSRSCSCAKKASASRSEINRLQRGLRCVLGINDRTESP